MSVRDDSVAWVPALLQVSDPLFPTGAYAHSMGLEEWAKQCSFGSGEDLIRFFNEHVGPALTRLELPYLRFVREALTKDEWEA
ncbi:MAG: urease accessory protein UreF, partial [Verrucomicrobiota bacterium]